MVRGLTLAVALALGTVTVPAHALGLGDIKAHSALNETFSADIDLLSVAAGELDGIRVRLAEQKEFDKAGVERPFFLSLLKFVPERLDNGQSVVRVSSDFPIREPFLDFLVEVAWPRGRLIREYTVLLDPPVTTRRRAPRVRPVQAVTPTAPAASRSSGSDAAVTPVSNEYGPIAANETLWSVATKLRPRGASMEQMMIALLHANPEAFIEGDINRLRRGAILRVPDTENILSVSRQQAHQTYVEAQRQWTARISQTQQPAEARPQPQEGEGSVSAPLEEETNTQAELRIATARPEGEGEAGASEDRGDESIDELKDRLLLARENAEASRLESETLRKQLDDIQKRLQDMQRLISLKDEQLAQIQAGVVHEEAPAAPAATVVPAEAGTAEEGQAVAGAEQSAIPEQTLEPAVKPSLPEGDEMAAGEPFEELEIADESNLIAPADEVRLAENDLIIEPESVTEPEPVIEQESITEPEPAPAPAEPESVQPGASPQPEAAPGEEPLAEPAGEMAPVPEKSGAKEPPVAGPDFSEPDLQALLLNRNMLYAAGGALALILLLMLLIRRRNNKDVAETEPMRETPPATPEPVGVPVDAVDGETDGLPLTGGVADRPGNGLEGSGDNVDPVSEADVYIAYGRYQPAEDLLREAIDQDPERFELKSKLLEVYYATRNIERFNALAGGMAATGQDKANPDGWEHVRGMGRELDEHNPLYAGSDKSPNIALDTDVDAEGAADVADDSSLDLDLVDSTLTDVEREERLLADTIDEPLLDIEDIEELENLEALGNESLSLDELESMELEVPDLESGTGQEHDRAGAVANDLLLDSLDLPSLKQASASQGGTSDSHKDRPDMELDELDDLSSLDVDLGEMSGEPANKESPLDQPISLDEAFDQEIGSDVEPLDIDSLETEVPEAELADIEAVSTKLELARAFVEMDDGEGARGILEEVVKEGSEDQRQEAQKLLDAIA